MGYQYQLQPFVLSRGLSSLQAINSSDIYTTNIYSKDGKVNLTGNLTIAGNLTALGTTTFAGTIYSNTSALSVINFGNGTAFYVGQSGLGDIASFYDLDTGTEVLHVGGNNGTFPNVGIKTSTPNKTLTVNGEISASGKIWGDGTGLTLPAPTASTLGGVKAGTNITIAGDGTISGSASYTLPVATASVLGGVKQGTNITIAGDGTISGSAPYTLPVATTSVLGGVKQGTNITIDAGGVISSPVAAGHTHSYTDLTNRPSLQAVATSGSYNDLINRPTLAAVATSGSYTDLTNRPALGSSAAIDVATSGDATSAQVVKGNDTRLTNSRTPTGTAGGDLTGNYPNPTLANTTVPAGSFGTSSQVATFTVDAKGRLTAAGHTNIAISSGSVSGLAASATTDTTNAGNINNGTLPAARMPAFTGGDVTSSSGSVNLTLANTNVAAGNYGSATQVPVITVDAKGRITSATNTNTTIPAYTTVGDAAAGITKSAAIYTVQSPGPGYWDAPVGCTAVRVTLVGGGQVTTGVRAGRSHFNYATGSTTSTSQAFAEGGLAVGGFANGSFGYNGNNGNQNGQLFQNGGIAVVGATGNAATPGSWVQTEPTPGDMNYYWVEGDPATTGTVYQIPWSLPLSYNPTFIALYGTNFGQSAAGAYATGSLVIATMSVTPLQRYYYSVGASNGLVMIEW